MEEPERKSMLHFVESNRASDICRLIYCAKTNESSDHVLKAFSLAAKEYSSEAVTGLLLVYPQYLVHLIEAPEEEIFQLCRYLFVKCSPFTGRTKCFPAQVEAGGRFFNKWYGRKASEYNFTQEKQPPNDNLEDNFEIASTTYKRTLLNLYQFYRELRLLSDKNHKLMVERLESLNEDGHRLLACSATMEFILNSRWGQSVQELTDHFLNPVSVDPNTAWPIPKITLPRVDFQKIDGMKNELKRSSTS
ncbi:uncharacterized protein LOC124293028 [Neodiprion lecontei]|uniref:Uncharacterized protein LOC124293028 n=1 Tax=Neodiprion lecontei TaxID=441921 RepID=A0ABM3FIM6_NEOLC|nr:uncharacterized protein LOC124293028 [Neodiprion lecontei]